MVLWVEYIFFVSMIKIQGYKEVEYPDFVEVMLRHKSTCGKSDMQIAIDIDVKTHNTVKNAFNKNTQVVSDKVLTKVISSIGMDAFVIWKNGHSSFYVANKS